MPSPLRPPSPRTHKTIQVWNGQFDQTWYAYDQGKRLKLDPDAWTALVKFYSQRSQEVNWKGVEGG